MVRSLDIVIGGDPKGALAAMLATQMAAIKTNAVVSGALTAMGSASTKAFLGMGVVAAASGVALINLGKNFQEAENTIRVGTGATGKALEGLKDDFRAVVSEVPASFGKAATAIADVNTRLGLTGQPLQEVSQNFLTLSRITKTDLPGNIQRVTRLFQDWGITQEQMVPTMDKLFRASQSTGIGIDRLSQLMVDFGSPLRQLGVDFDFAAAMFANFERSGVATEKLMPGIRIALKTLGGAMPAVTEELKEMGISTDDVQQGFIDAFNAIKNAGSTAEAVGIAFKVFGVRAGPDMAAAIREGRFEIDDLMDVIANGSDTIKRAGEDTMTFTERWQLFKNRVAVALEPLATKLFDAFERGSKILADPRVADGVAKLGVALGALATLAVVGKVIMMIATGFVGLKGAALAVGGALFAAASAVLFLMTPVGLVGTAIIIFRDKIVGAFVAVKDGVLTAVDTVVGAVLAFHQKTVSALGTARDFFIDAFGKIQTAVEAVIGFFTGTVVPFFQRVWNALVDPLKIALAVIKVLFTILIVAVTAPLIIIAALIISHWSKIKTATSAIWTAIVAVINFVWREISGFVIASVQNIQTIISVAWTVIRTVTSVAWTVISAVIRFVWREISGFVIASVQNLQTIISVAWTVIRTVTVAVWNAVGEVIQFVWRNVIQPVWRAIQAFIHNVLVPVFEFLRARLSEIWSAIREIVQAAWHFIRDRIFKPIGTFITDTVLPAFRRLRDGMKEIWESIKTTASEVWGAIVRNVKGPINSIIGFINTLIGGLNKVLEKIPGIGFSIPKIPELATGGTLPGAGAASIANALARAGRAEGGLIDVSQFGPFITKRPMAVVGEGNPAHPEFVIPTDPAHHQRALRLYNQLGNQLQVPGMAIGGVLGDVFDKGKDFVSGAVSAAGGFVEGLARKALTGIFSPINAAVKAALNRTPNVLHMRDVVQEIREALWQWVKGADTGLPEQPRYAHGSLPRGKGVAGLREPVASMAAKVLEMGRGLVYIVSGWRSTAQQAVLYSRWLRGVPGQARAAPPGSSKHERGLAVDWGGNRAVYQRLWRSVGGHFPVRGEAWHGEAIGYRSGGVVGPRGGFVHPGEVVLTHADQLQVVKMIRGGGGATTIVNVEPGAIVVGVPKDATEDQARRLGGSAAKGFMEVLAQRRVLADARIK